MKCYFCNKYPQFHFTEMSSDYAEKTLSLCSIHAEKIKRGIL